MTDETDPFAAAYDALPDTADSRAIVAFLGEVLLTYADDDINMAATFMTDLTTVLREYFKGNVEEAEEICMCDDCVARRAARVLN